MNKQHNITKHALAPENNEVSNVYKIQLLKIKKYQTYYCISCIQESTAFQINKRIYLYLSRS